MELLEYLKPAVGTIILISVCGLLVLAVARVWSLVAGRNRDEDKHGDDPARFCGQCGYDLRASDERCPECGADIADMRARAANTELDPHALRDDWPVQEIAPRKPGFDEVPVTVHETTNSLEANLLVAQLQARGVQAGIQTEEETHWAGRAYANRVNRLVRVPSDDEALAKSIVDRFRWKQAAVMSDPGNNA